MAGIYDEGCCEMLKLEAGVCDYPTNSWVWFGNTVAFGYVSLVLESLRNSRILLIKVLEDHKFLEVIVEALDRL